MVRRVFGSAASAALVTLVLLAAALTAARAGGTAGFVGGLEDVPLMAGLSEAEEGAMVFDTPAGRIAEAYATGDSSPAAVLDFYRETLPQLGWQPAGPDAFLREGEVLRLDFPTAGNAGTVVRFTLSPAE